jgi:cation:H+ antiporter
MDIIFDLLLIGLGFVFLIKGADLLVEGSAALAIRLSVSEIVIGLTVVSFGTSAPELIVNILASIQEKSDITMGNVIGSNIINILLILGVAGLLKPILTEKNTVWREIPFSLLAAIALFIACNDSFFGGGPDQISRSDGLLFLLFFIIFITYSFAISGIEFRDQAEIRTLSPAKIALFMTLGLAGLVGGGKLVVDNAIDVARLLNVSEKVIGLTIVAIGTSLPELFTSAVAAFKGKSDIAMGNIVGSNIFNIFFILAVSSIIRPISFTPQLNVDIVVLIAASVLLFLTMFIGNIRKLDRGAALIFLVFYFVYFIFLMIRR